MFLPMIEPRLFVALQSACAVAVDPTKAVTTQRFMQQQRNAPADLWHRGRGSPFFFPAVPLASGAMWRSTTASDDDASRSRYALGNGTSLPRFWRAADILQFGARPWPRERTRSTASPRSRWRGRAPH